MVEAAKRPWKTREQRIESSVMAQVQYVAPKVRVDICKEKPSIASKAHSTHRRTDDSKTVTVTYTIFAEGLYRTHFGSFIACEIVARKIKNLPGSAGELRPETFCNGDYAHRREIGLLP